MVEMDHMTTLHQSSEFSLVEEEGHTKKILIESKQSIFQLALQKQGLKQQYHSLREVDKSCTKLTKDGGR
jgi:hypothetical protein